MRVARILAKNPSGQPAVKGLQRTWGLRTVVKRTVPMKRVRTLIKANPSDGTSLGDFYGTMTAKRTSFPGRRTAAGVEKFQKPNTPPAAGAGVTKIRPPRPSMGVLRYFNTNRKIR